MVDGLVASKVDACLVSRDIRLAAGILKVA